MGERFRLSYSPERILAGLATADLIDERFKAALHQHKDAILPGLIDAAANGAGYIGLNACSILLELGETIGSKGLVDRIKGPSTETRLRAMESLTHLPFDSSRGGYQVPVDKTAVFGAVAPLLESIEPRISALALDILENLGTAEADAMVMTRINDLKPETRMSIACWLGRQGVDRGALDIVEDLVFGPSRNDRLIYRLIGAIKNICDKGSVEDKSRACKLAIRFVRQNLNCTDNGTANHVWWCLKAITAAGSWYEASLLQEVLASPLEWWVRGIALQRLSEIEGKAGLSRLCKALKDRALRKDAAESLAKLAKHLDDPGIIDAIGEALKEETEPRIIAQMAKAFVVAGGSSRALLRNVMARSEPNTAMMIHWILKGIEPKEAADLLMTTGLAMPGAEEFAQYEARWQDDYDAKALLLTLISLSGSLAIIMVEAHAGIPDHTEMVADLCAAAQGFFEVENLHQSVAEGGELTVGFTHKGKPYILSADRLGRFLDLPSIMEGLNEILRKTRNKGRFFQIYEEGEVGLVVFAQKNEFLKVARKLRIPLEMDHDSSRKASIEYSNYVRAPHGGA
jgi:hypothetical protein